MDESRKYKSESKNIHLSAIGVCDGTLILYIAVNVTASKALTEGRTDNFATDVTGVKFPI